MDPITIVNTVVGPVVFVYAILTFAVMRDINLNIFMCSIDALEKIFRIVVYLHITGIKTHIKNLTNTSI